VPRENAPTAPRSDLDPQVADRLRRDEHGLVAAVVQQHDTREVLMVGWMDDEALHRTLTSGRVTFWSRSRQEYWRKGDTSGHAQYVKAVSLDCDGDALLVEVDQVGAACHTGTRTCFEAGGPVPAVVGDRPDPAADQSAVPASRRAPARPTGPTTSSTTDPTAPAGGPA